MSINPQDLYRAADEMAQWGCEAIPGLTVTELPGQDSRVLELLRINGEQAAQIIALKEVIAVLRNEPPMPAGFHGFTFRTQLDGVDVWALAQTDPEEDRPSRRYTPVYPEVMSLWINGAWVSVESLDGIADLLDDEAEAVCKRRWEDSWEAA